MGAPGPRIAALLLACALGGVGGLAPRAVDAQQGPPVVEQVRYREAPDQVVAVFHRVYPEFAEQESTPLLEVYGDRTVRVHHPAFMKHAGDYEMRLEPGEMADLMRMLAGAVIGFDAQDVRLQQQEAELVRWNAARRAEDVTVTYIADATLSRFDIEIESYRPAGARAEVAVNGPRAAAWESLAFEAERYPDIEALGALRAAESRLVDLSLDPRLRSVSARP